MKKKRLVSLVMVVVLMISVLQGIPGTRFSWNKDAYAADGAYADDIVDKDDETDLLGNPATKTVDQAIDWCKSKVGQSIDVDGYPYNQCVDFIKAYYQYLGASPVLGDGKDYSWNSLPSGWTRVQGGAPQRGDILVYGASESNSAGHVAIYESEYSTYHQNFGNNGMITRETYRYNGFTNPYWGYIRPQWENDNHPWGTVDTISSDNGEVTFRGWAFDLDNTSKAISIHVYIDGPAGTGRMFSSGTANKERTDVNDKYGTGKNHGYEFSVPTNITGSHSFYVYAINIDKNGGNGGGYLHNPEIGNRTIIVKGDTEKPVISDVEIIDKDETGYTVKFKATDNNKIDRVQCPTWTTKNDQDDIAKDWQNSTAVKATSLGNNMYQFKVKTSDHNNELGQYRTHIYAYDPAGNYVNYSLNNIIVSDTPVLGEDGYYHCRYLSEEITSEDYIIQYKNTYEKVQKDSPGAGWVKGETVKNEWVNSGGQYNNEADLPTSDARILVKHIYYHFCGPNAGNEGNYEQTGKFVHYDEIDDSRYGVRIASTGMDGSHPYYLLNWADSGARVYCKSGVTCDGSYGSHGERCQAWYRWNVYQDRVKVEQYRYTKVSDWVDSADSSAKSTEIRYKSRCEHDYEVIDSKDATCTEDGYTTFKCSKCDDEYTDTTKALGHEEEIDEAVEPTCTETGLTAGVHCSRCKAILTAQEEVEALGHDEVVVKEVPATCITDGFTQYKKCNRCGETIEPGSVIPAKGHSWDDGEVVKEATETESGVKLYTCSVCKEKKYEVISPIGTPEPPVALSVENIYGLKNEMMVGDNIELTVRFNREPLEDESFEWVVTDVLGVDGNPVAPGTEDSIITIDADGYVDVLGAGKAEISYILNGVQSETSFTVEVYDRYDTPEKPVKDTVTATSIKVVKMDGCLYSLDGINWQEDNTFTNLEPNTMYSVFAKRAGKGYMKESNMSKGALIVTEKNVVWPFKDLPESNQLAPEVKYAYDKGVISGFSAPDANGQVNVKPNQNVTRAQFAIMIYKMAGSPGITAEDLNKSQFSDVSSGTTGFAEIVWANSKGIISGFGNGKFKPNNNISRSQIAIMLKKFGDYKNCQGMYVSGGTSISSYSDYSEVKEGAKADLQWAVDNGILSGVSSTKMKPNGPSTRGQCAAFCARFYKTFIE